MLLRTGLDFNVYSESDCIDPLGREHQQKKKSQDRGNLKEGVVMEYGRTIV